MSSWNTFCDSDAARKSFARMAAMRLRRRLLNPVLRRVDPRRFRDERWMPAQGTATPEPAVSRPPSALWLEATDSQGQLASWWSGDWWGRCLASWGRAAVTVVLLPTPGAILMPAVLEQLGRVCVAARKWRLIAQTRGDELASTAAVDRLLRTPYHEVEFLAGDDVLPGRGRGYVAWRAQRILAVMKQVVELRGARGLTRPLVAWRWDAGRAPAAPPSIAEAQALARQLQVDRFVVPGRAE